MCKEEQQYMKRKILFFLKKIRNLFNVSFVDVGTVCLSLVFSFSSSSPPRQKRDDGMADVVGSVDHLEAASNDVVNILFQCIEKQRNDDDDVDDDKGGEENIKKERERESFVVFLRDFPTCNVRSEWNVHQCRLLLLLPIYLFP